MVATAMRTNSAPTNNVLYQCYHGVEVQAAQYIPLSQTARRQLDEVWRSSTPCRTHLGSIASPWYTVAEGGLDFHQPEPLPNRT